MAKHFQLFASNRPVCVWCAATVCAGIDVTCAWHRSPVQPVSPGEDGQGF